MGNYNSTEEIKSGATNTPDSVQEIKPQIQIINKPSIPTHKSTKEWSENDYLNDLLGEEFLRSLPVISIQNGSTDYLDRVKEEDFVDDSGNTVSLVKGVDCHGRHFVSMRLDTSRLADKDTDGGEFIHERFIYTIFRRYTDLDSVWVICKSHYSQGESYVVEYALDCSTVIRENTRKNLQKLFTDYQSGNNGVSFEYRDWSGEEPKVLNIKFY